MLKKTHPLYVRWTMMRQRCLNPNFPKYPRYGGRGITICPAWYDFWNYVEDVGPCPEPGFTLDRIDNDGNYEPSNIRWATPKQQANNRNARRDRREYTLDGITHTQAEWSRLLGIPQDTLNRRRKLGWSDNRILTTEIDKSFYKNLTLDGITHSQSEWARILKIDPKIISRRQQQGWSDEMALTTAVRPCLRREMTLNGETHILTEWSSILKISQATIESRRNRGWSDERILTTPVNMKCRNKAAK